MEIFLVRSREDCTNARFLSGHFGYVYAKSFMQDRYSFTFLRDPRERLVSLYSFCRSRRAEQFSIYSIARDNTLDDFLKLGFPESKAMNRVVAHHIWNNQAWMLACGPAPEGSPESQIDGQVYQDWFFATPALAERAISHLSTFDRVGLTETYVQDSRRVLLDLGIAHKRELERTNATQGRVEISDLPRSTLELLDGLTKVDKLLYEYAADIVDVMTNFDQE